MKNISRITLNDKSSFLLDTKQIKTDKYFVKVNEHFDDKNEILFFLISHNQLNTFIDLTSVNPCVVLYFDENYEFTGASYNSYKSDSFFSIQTQSKNIMIMQLPIEFSSQEILKIDIDN